jgi:hypothetical protein
MVCSVDASLCAQDNVAVPTYRTAQSKAMIDEAPTLNGVTGDGQPDGTSTYLSWLAMWSLRLLSALGVIPARRSGLY